MKSDSLTVCPENNNVLVENSLSRGRWLDVSTLFPFNIINFLLQYFFHAVCSKFCYVLTVLTVV